MSKNRREDAHKPLLTIKTDGRTYEISVLNPGESFPHFGGSKHPLYADKKSASLIVREITPNMHRDMEHDIFDPAIWTWIANLINDRDGKVEARADR